jgi:hypothetical protein
MARKPISRTLQLKPVQFSASRPEDEVTLVDLMRELRDRCPTVGSCVWEQTVALADGTRIPQQCYFFNNYQDLDEKTIIFEVWSAVDGCPVGTSHSFIPLFTAWDARTESPFQSGSHRDCGKCQSPQSSGSCC